MQKSALYAVFVIFISSQVLPVIAQVTKAAEPGSEYTAVAGNGPFHVDVHLRSVATQRLRVFVRYGRETAEGRQRGYANAEVAFQCQGLTEIGKQNVTVECDPPLATVGGVYMGVGTVTVRRDETNASKEYTEIRLPIVTIEPNPLADNDFPDIVGTSLSLDNRQSLADGSRKSQIVLNSLSAHIKPGNPNSKEIRAYLQEVAEEERRVINITRRRYLGDTSNRKAPIFFEDFDRRLEAIIRELGGTPSPRVVAKHPAKGHFLLVQMPHTSDSITINGNSPNTISRSLTDLVGVLTDAVKGLLGMSESGTTSFHWSATTTPPGADIYISRLGESETKWAGATDVKDTTLENARWTFRFDWNGCSKRENPNPFLQLTISLKLAKEGCRRP